MDEAGQRIPQVFTPGDAGHGGPSEKVECQAVNPHCPNMAGNALHTPPKTVQETVFGIRLGTGGRRVRNLFSK